MSQNLRSIIVYERAIYFVLPFFYGLEKMNSSSEAEQLFQDYFQWKIQQFPEYATIIGIHDYDRRLNDLSVEAYEQRLAKCRQFRQKLKNLRPRVKDDLEVASLDHLQFELDIFINNYDLKTFYMSFGRQGGPQALHFVLDRMPLNTTRDFEVMIKRLSNVPKKLDEYTTMLKLGVDHNITLHNRSMFNLDKIFAVFVVVNASSSPLYKYFENFPPHFTEEEIQTIERRAQDVILNQVSPAFANLADYVTNEYITRPDIGISTIPNGKEIYDKLIFFHTSKNLTAEEIQAIGYSEVARIEALMQEIVNQLGFSNLNVQQFSNLLRKDPANYYNSTQQITEAYEKIVNEVVPPQLPAIFEKIPKNKIVMQADESPQGSGAFYILGSLDGKRPGTFYFSTAVSKPKYEMLSLSLHEASPGHHYQASYHSEYLQTLPLFRKKPFGGGHYSAAPSAFPKFTAYLEGWALYTETLGFDMNLYDDLLDRYGHYSQEIFRACRLVVDTGVHAFGWTRERAVDYMFNHTASSISQVEAQIDRYIAWPGQALAYKIGQMQITNLRKEATETLKELFDLKEFHTIILENPGPLELMELAVHSWIKSKQQLQNTTIASVGL